MHESWSIDREEKRRNYRQKGRENCDCHAHPILSRFSFSFPLRLSLSISLNHMSNGITFQQVRTWISPSIIMKSIDWEKLVRNQVLQNYIVGLIWTMKILRFTIMMDFLWKNCHSSRCSRKCIIQEKWKEKCEYTEFLFRIEDTLFKKIKSWICQIFVF